MACCVMLCYQKTKKLKMIFCYRWEAHQRKPRKRQCKLLKKNNLVTEDQDNLDLVQAVSK